MRVVVGWLYGEVTIVSEKLKLHWLTAKKANRTVSKDTRFKVRSGRPLSIALM